MRDGAGPSRPRWLSLGSPPASPVLPAALVSAVLRSGESCGATKLLRTGLNSSGVTVWACAEAASSATSARHGKSARNMVARFSRPSAGPDVTIELPQRIHLLSRTVPAALGTDRAENVVNG